MPHIKRIITLAAITAATAVSTPGIAGAAASAGSSSGSASIPSADMLAAERAATHTSASLDRFGLIHIHAIPPPIVAATVTPAEGHVAAPSGGFDWGDAGIGAAGGVALSMLGLAGALTLSQRRARRSSRSAALTS